MKKSQRDLLRLIAVFKLLKAALLIAVGVGVLKLLHEDLAGLVEECADLFRLGPSNRYINAAMEKASNLTPHRIEELGLGSLVFGGLFLTEGIGLWFLKRWAEWLTVIITSSLLPIEVYEIYRHPSPLRFAVLAVNIAIVAYLIYQIRSKK
jgi:uncharacterized membrane protein (DUF2068 family)